MEDQDGPTSFNENLAKEEVNVGVLELQLSWSSIESTGVAMLTSSEQLELWPSFGVSPCSLKTQRGKVG